MARRNTIKIQHKTVTHDQIHGGKGRDVIKGHEADDMIHGGEGRDVLFGRRGDDALFGGAGSDKLFGGKGDDSLYGGGSADRLFGGHGKDILDGGAGSDDLFGGLGVDTAVYDGAISDYDVTGIRNKGTVKAYVTDASGATDRLHSVERIYFAGDDYTAWLDGRNNVVKAVDDAVTVGEDDSATIDATANDLDFDGDALTITALDITGLIGTATLNDDGTIAYSTDGAFESLAEGETTTTSFTYTVSDGQGSTDTGTVTITVTGENDAPVLDAPAAVTVDENTTAVATVSATDVDGDELTYSLGGADAALFSIGADGTLSFVDAPDFEAPADADGDNLYEVTVTVTDGRLSDSQDIVVTVADVLEGPRINEFHYDNVGDDVGEFIEIAAPAGFDLTGYSIVLYNGSATQRSPYRTIELSGIVEDQNDGIGYIAVEAVDLQNGSPDGFAFVDPNGDVVEFLSYEGTFTAASGPAEGLTSTDIVAEETGATPIGYSLALQEDGTWTAGPATRGIQNDAYAQLQISELAVNTTGTDWEFVELSGVAGTSLDGLQIIQVRGDYDYTNGDADDFGTVWNVIDLDGQVIGENGFFLATSDEAQSVFGVTDNLSIPNNTFLNDTSSVFLVRGDIADGADLDADNDGVLDAPLDALDAVSLLNESEGLQDVTYVDPVVGPDGRFLPAGVERQEDGSWRITSFSNSGDYSPTAGTGGEEPPAPEPVLISEIQGSGTASPLDGTIVSVSAVVTAVVADGFYLQEEGSDVDGDDATSEGIFVFTGRNSYPSVTITDVIYATGTVAESFGFTQLTDATYEVLSTGANLPTAVQLSLPVTYDLEPFEGMRVSLSAGDGDAPLTIIENFDFDRYGELVVSEGTQIQPTQIYDAQTDAAEVQALLAANQANRIIIDDGVTDQNPDSFAYIANTSAGDDGDGILSAGDTYTADGPTVRLGAQIDGSIDGVLSYGFGEYKIIPTETLNIDPATNEGARPDAAPEVGGDLKVVSFNALNYFTTLGERGADSAFDLERQTEKLVNALVELDGDVVALQEVENNGFGDGSAIAALVDALNARLGADVYAFVDPTEAGETRIGTDAITTAVIYKVDSVQLVASDVYEFTPTQDRDGNNTINEQDQLSRPAIAAAFEEIGTGEVFTVVNNHFKSKGPGGADGLNQDQNDGQGAYNYERTQAAEQLAAWLATDPLGTGDPDVLILGDLNAYSQEDPVQALEDAGYANLLELFVGAEDAFSFIFDGQQGALDQALSSQEMLAQITGLAEWHINAQEPDLLGYSSEFGDAGFYNRDDVFAASDHDPLVIGLNLGETATV